MTDSPTQLPVVPRSRPPDEAGLNLGFTLSFISGRGLLTSRDKQVGPFEVKVLELEIPNIEFPFDVTGGSDRFKTRRCNLRHLAISIDADGLGRAMTRPVVEHGGFLEVRTAIRDGFVQLGGRFAIGEHAADFTMRLALLIHSPRELSIVFYDTRMYGWLPIPAATLPVYLQQALQIPFVSVSKAGAWTLTPVDDFLRAVLPRAGWKVPDTRTAGLSVADVARGRISLSAGVTRDPNAKQRREREPPAEAVAAGEGIAAFAKAEESLAAGDFGDAYHRYREAMDDERGGRFARERLLQIGAADPELALETRQLAEEILVSDPRDVQAHLALGAIAMRERAWGEAATRYARLAELARAENLRYDMVAAELAGAAAAAPVDPATALASYERAAARARDSVIAHQALFEVRQANQDWDGAAKAGERLARLIQDPGRASAIHRQLGVMHRVHRGDLKRARVHFEKALKIEPDDPAALEGLAETYAARGEPARAATYLARLAEHAEASADEQRIIGLNLRLGEIWERWLGDEENASRRYQRVLDVDPRNRTARLRLASLAEKLSDWNRARALYEDLLAVEEERGDPDATSDLVQAYTRLARVTLQTDGATPEAIACLERAVELDPSNRPARDELARVMRERGEWSRLAQLLDEAARHSSNFQEARRSRLDAARLQLSYGGDPEVARRHLEAILDRQADDPDALELLVPLLSQNDDVGSLITRLEQAADVTTEPVRRAQHMLALANVRAHLGMDPESQRAALEAALDANPYLFDAAQRLVHLLEDNRDFDRLARALGRLSVASPRPSERAEALVKRATILWRELERVELAEQSFKRALQLVPGDFAAWNQLSRLYESSGQLGAARTALETALGEAEKRGISTAPLYERMAELARSQNDPDAEVESLSKAISAGLRTEKIAQRLIRVLSQLDRGREAAELLEEWASDAKTEDNDRLLLQAASLRRSLGETERASHTFAEIVQRGGPVAWPAAEQLERLAFERGDGARERLALHYLATHTDGDEQVELYERWVNALYRHGEKKSLESTARELLELDPRSPTAHYRLAQRLEADESFNEALMHYERLLLETKRERMDRAERRDAFVHAAGLAHEIHPNLIPRLQEAFDFEFPEAQDDALDRPLGEVLRAEERWEELYRLRRSQIEWVDEAKRRVFEADIAELLHHRLGRLEESIPFYQSCIASSDPTVARAALIDVFERLGRFGDLASHLFAMSQLEPDRDTAMSHGLRSARIYGDELGDRAAAQQVLRTLLQDSDRDWRFGALMDALRDFELYSELSLLTEKSLEAEPSADDGRLTELLYLLTRALNDPTRAVDWARRMAERYPAVDEAWKAYTELLEEYPTLGDRPSALREWAELREGAARARVLIELAATHRDDGDPDAEIAVLEEALSHDENAIGALETLVERSISRGDWNATVRWLEQLANATEDTEERDARWRRLIEVAVDYADDPSVAVRGLQALREPTEDERAHLTQLYVETGNLEGMQRQFAAIAASSVEEQLRAGQAAFAGDHRDLARRFFELAMTEDAPRAWATVSELWHEAGAIEELARWRLQRADEMDAGPSHALRLEAYAELLDAELGGIDGLDEAVSGAVISDVPIAWAVFRIGRSVENTEWQHRAAVVLDQLLAEDDPRTRSVLVFRARRELDRGEDPDAAVELARRLLQMGEPSASQLLESALEAAGRTDELIAALRERAEASDSADVQAVLWTRITELEIELDDIARASEDLERVPEGERGRTWASLALRLGELLGDPELRIRGAQVAMRSSVDDGERATWLLQAARIALWELGDEERGHAWLRDAHALAPQTSQQFVVALEEASDPESEQRLVEGFVVYEGVETYPLWNFKLHRARDAGDLGGARAALDVMTELTAADDRDGWVELAGLATMLDDPVRNRDLLRRAYALDRGFEEEYLVAVRRAGSPADVIAALEERAEELSGEDAMLRYERAAGIADDELTDRVLALSFYERAVRSFATRGNLAATVDLAHDLGKLAVVAALSGPLLERTEPEAPERGPLLRRYVDALEAVSSTLEMLEPLRELDAMGLASALDRARLAELLEDDDPRRAAELYEAAALDEENAGRAEPVVAAAERWHALGEGARAADLVREALERGADDLPVHVLGAELLSGEERLRSLERLLELEGDQDWDEARRHRSRVELGEWRLNAGELDRALSLGQAAEGYGDSDAHVLLMESIWAGLGEDDALAKLRLDVIGAGRQVWDRAARVLRLRESVGHFREQGDVANEYRALDLLLRDEPEDAESRERLMSVMAELGDLDTFVEQVESQWESRSGAAERAELALRYAPVFLERFEEPEVAIRFLRRSYEEEPTLRVLETVLDAAERAGTLARDFEWLDAGAIAMRGDEVRLALELRLADVAENDLGDLAAVFRIHRRVFDRDPSVETSRDWIIPALEQREEWEDLVAVLERAAHGAEQRGDQKRALLRALEIVETHLESPGRWIELAQRTLEIDPDDRGLATALCERHLGAGHWRQARLLVERERVDKEREHGLLLRLIDGFRAAGHDADVEALRSLLAERFPESAEAGLYRLEQARAEGDARAIMLEAEKRIAKVKDLDASEWIGLHDEAGDASLEVGEPENALVHYLATLDTPDPTPQSVLKAAELAADLENEEKLGFVQQVAARMRELITTEAIKTKGDDRIRWFTLLGQAHEKAGDESAAIEAFRQAFALSGSEAMRPFDALGRLYRRKGAWSDLVALEENRAGKITDPEQRARAYMRVAKIQLDDLGDEDAAQSTLNAVLEVQPDFDEAKQRLGLLMMHRGEYERGVELLEGRIDLQSEETPADILSGYFEGLKTLGRRAEAIDVASTILRRKPDDSTVLRALAELLEAEGRLDEADAAWADVLARLGPMADAEIVLPVLVRLAQGAKRRGDDEAQIDFLERAVELDDGRADLLRALRMAVEASGETRRAAALYEREAGAIPNDDAKAELLLGAARLLRGEHAEEELFRVLSRVREVREADSGILGELVSLAERLGYEERFFELAAALEAREGIGSLDAEVLVKLAAAAEDGDLSRARSLYAELRTRRPADLTVRDKLRDLALATEDYAMFAELEEASIGELEDAYERVDRYKSLASIVLKELKRPKQAGDIVRRALELSPEDNELRKRLADTYALDAGSYQEATAIYRDLLAQDPFDTGLLRILARLFGQVGDTDRAFGYYAALRALLPGDEEATRFVDACRKAMPAAPPRPLNDKDRGRGLIHPGQLGPVEELYAPLARFAELTHPGDLRLRGVEERDQLAPNDETAQGLLRVLEAVGLQKVELYAWRGGGFACEVELIGKPAILLGSMLMSDATERQRAFLTARAGELYRTGHTLCDRLSPAQLESLAAGLAQAVLPDASVPGFTTQSQEWAKVIGAPMTPQIRQQLAPRVHQFISRFGEVDVAAWRRACLSTAARTALVVCCDIDEAIAAMLRLRGFDDVADDQKPAVLRESPEELDLWTFALSDEYFKLRASLGIALKSG